MGTRREPLIKEADEELERLLDEELAVEHAIRVALAMVHLPVTNPEGCRYQAGGIEQDDEFFYVEVTAERPHRDVRWVKVHRSWQPTDEELAELVAAGERLTGA